MGTGTENRDKNTPHTVCMIVQDKAVKGGIAAVLSGYYGSFIEQDYHIVYVESYCDGSKWKKLKKALSGYRHFRRVLRQEKPELVHMHSSFGPSFFRSVPFISMAHAAGVKIINHIHGSEFDRLYTDAPGWKQRMIRRYWGMCDAFIVLSEAWKEKFSVVIPKEKMTVIHNYGPLLPPREEGACHNQLLFLGAIIPMKGCYDLVDIVKNLSEVRPEIRLVMAGDGEIDGVRAHAEELGVADRIEFPGWVRGAEKEKLLRESDVFVLPSYTEAMPMSALDAMGAGLPVVASGIGGLPDLVEEDGNGYLRAPGDVAGFTEAVGRALFDDEKRIALGRKSREIAEKNYSLESHLRAVEGVYERVLKKGGFADA